MPDLYVSSVVSFALQLLVIEEYYTERLGVKEIGDTLCAILYGKSMITLVWYSGDRVTYSGDETDPELV